MRRAGFNTSNVAKALRTKAGDAGPDITWNWHHLDHKLESVFGKVSWDARGLTQWLSDRKHKLGLMSEYTQDAEGCLERVFFVEEGAKEHWAAGNHVAFYDTTHSTKQRHEGGLPRCHGQGREDQVAGLLVAEARGR